MRYIVSSTMFRVRIAYVKDSGFGYETRAFTINRCRQFWCGEPIVDEERMSNWYLSSERGEAEKNLYDDSDMKVCWNPKEFGEAKCSTQS